jgi:hypothetical protein
MSRSPSYPSGSGPGELRHRPSTPARIARDPAASVHAVLAMFATPWLLIFDNAADLAAVAEFLPPAGPGRMLITSQNAAWPARCSMSRCWPALEDRTYVSSRQAVAGVAAHDAVPGGPPMLPCLRSPAPDHSLT